MHGPFARMITVQVSADVQQTTRLTQKESPLRVHEIRTLSLTIASDISGYSTAHCHQIHNMLSNFLNLHIERLLHGNELFGLIRYTKPSEDMTRLVVGDLAFVGSA